MTNLRWCFKLVITFNRRCEWTFSLRFFEYYLLTRELFIFSNFCVFLLRYVMFFSFLNQTISILRQFYFLVINQ